VSYSVLSSKALPESTKKIKMFLLFTAPLSQSSWRVFLLSEPSPHLPEILLLFSHQLAWDVVQRQDRYQYLSVESIDLKETIIRTLQVSFDDNNNEDDDGDDVMIYVIDNDNGDDNDNDDDEDNDDNGNNDDDSGGDNDGDG